MKFVGRPVQVKISINPAGESWQEIRNGVGKKYHSQKGIDLVMKVVNCLEEEAENGAAESYPFEMIEVIKEEVWSIEL